MNYSDYEIKKLYLKHKNYPKSLFDLPDPPKAIYYRGNLPEIDFSRCMAVVGSRNMTSYGKQVLEKIIPDLIAANVTIVSGFMYGVDTYAHKLALECGGVTVAVFGNGLDIVYPVESDKLYSQILDRGAVISEYDANTKPHLWTYPKRNRIVAAISLMGTLVIEASRDSGSLITAKYAKKLKRKVYAIPGPITSVNSSGTNYLIKKGQAKMVLSSQDLVKIEQTSGSEKPVPVLNGLDAKIYQTLSRENLTLDELSLAISEEIETVTSAITILSMQNIVEEIGGKLFLKKKLEA
jgi:DNA processing protein